MGLFGSKIDEGAERERTYQRAVSIYPTPKTCTELNAFIQSISNEIDSQNVKKTATISTGGSGRVEARVIDGYTKRKDELVALSNKWFCEQNFENQQTTQFLNTATKQLEAVQKMSDKTDN